MAWTLKRCRTSRNLPSRRCYVDRISGLPNELLSRILSFLSTKEAVATSVLSRRWRHAFTWITSLEFDDSLVYRGSRCPLPLQHFPTFKSFVDNILQVSQTEYLSSFTLKSCQIHRWQHRCSGGCFPDVTPMNINAWISFPLTRGVRELNLDFYVRRPGKLPLALFTCETLEVLKLMVNLDIQAPVVIHLPNLKVFKLLSLRIPVQDFVSRLASSCPLLEDLEVNSCGREQGDSICISAPSLRSLFMDINNDYAEDNSSELVVFDSPKLHTLYYADNMLARHYSINNMNAVVKAAFCIYYDIGSQNDDGEEAVFCNMLNLVRPLLNVEHLSLLGLCPQALQISELKNKLPVFHRLRHLCLGYRSHTVQWHKVLLELLNYCPFLEILEFPERLSDSIQGDQMEEVNLESEFWKSTQAVPSCFKSHLKNIAMSCCHTSQRELNLISFLLANSSILEELLYRVNAQYSFFMTWTKT